MTANAHWNLFQKQLQLTKYIGKCNNNNMWLVDIYLFALTPFRLLRYIPYPYLNPEFRSYIKWVLLQFCYIHFWLNSTLGRRSYILMSKYTVVNL